MVRVPLLVVTGVLSKRPASRRRVQEHPRSCPSPPMCQPKVRHTSDRSLNAVRPDKPLGRRREIRSGSHRPLVRQSPLLLLRLLLGLSALPLSGFLHR